MYFLFIIDRLKTLLEFIFTERWQFNAEKKKERVENIDSFNYLRLFAFYFSFFAELPTVAFSSDIIAAYFKTFEDFLLIQFFSSFSWWFAK